MEDGRQKNGRQKTEPMNDAKQQFNERIGRFGRVRRGLANATLAYGVGALALGVGSVALILLCGWTQNPIANGVFTLAGGVALVWLLVRFLRRWERRRAILSEAFRAEALAGDLNSRLISAVDFLDRPEKSSLTEDVIAKARKDLERSFEALIDRSARNLLRRRFVLLLALFLLLGASPWFGFARLGSTVSLCAMDLREALFPTRFELFPGNKICRIGTEVEAGLRFTRFRYPEVTISKKLSDREGVEQSVIKVDASGRAVVKLRSTVEREYRIRFAFGKRTTEEMKLVFTTTPMIENMQVELVYPIYTRQVPRETEGIVDRITALSGTRVNMGFVFSKALKSAVLTFDDKTRMPLDVVGRFASVSFVHSLARNATLQVEDLHGFAMDAPHAIEFGLTVDTPPKLTVVPKTLTTDMPRTIDHFANFTFGARVEDDFGAAKCVVKWKKATTDKPNQIKVQGDPIERVFNPPRRMAVAAFENIFREQAQTAEPEDLFTFYVEAFDNRDPKPQSTQSTQFSIFIRGDDLEPSIPGVGPDPIIGTTWTSPIKSINSKYKTPAEGARTIGMPSALVTSEQGAPGVKIDRPLTETRADVSGAPGSATSSYLKNSGGSGAGSK